MPLRVTSGMVTMRLLGFQRESDLHIAGIFARVWPWVFSEQREATHRLRDLSRSCRVAMLEMTDILRAFYKRSLLRQ